jgi:hypothetical protein
LEVDTKMINDKDHFIQLINTQFQKVKHFKHGNNEYGSNVMPILKAYTTLSSPEERKSFREAIETMLEDKDQEVRRFAVLICLGFVVFKDAL